MEEIVCEVDEKKVNSIVKGILENTKKIHDCVIYDENNEVNNEINFNKIISMYYDLTGFEMFCNEILFLRSDEGYYYNPEDNFEEIDEPIMCCL